MQAFGAKAEQTDRDLIRMMIEEGDQLGLPHVALLEGLKSIGVQGKGLSLFSAASEVRSLQPYMSHIIDDFTGNNTIWWKLDEGKPKPAWAPAHQAIDYAHLEGFGPAPEAFEFSADDLAFLIKRNNFEIPDDQRKVIFGLRGCSHAQNLELSDWTGKAALKLSTPDHVTLRCIIGLWDRDSGLVRTFTASTVPEVCHMFLYVFKLAGCNLLPTGMYRYKVDTHRATSENPQHGALCEAENSVVVMRSPTDLVFNSTDYLEGWQSGRPGDNIHAAHFFGNAEPPRFSSAGCQVIVGSHRGAEASGPWAQFRSSANFPGGAQKEFRYVLLTGAEAALASARSSAFDASYNRVRFGSSGPAAGIIQERLRLSADNDFRRDSVMALLRHQKQAGAFRTPIAVV